jgi:transcriptional regulator with XRE-family HTH domain
MSPSSAPTARRQRLGTELRRLREHAGLTATEAAALLGGNQARISNIEAGRYGVSAERVRALACHYECGDQSLVEAMAGMTGERKGGWWEEYREILSNGLLDLAELEHYGCGLSTAHISGFPGLLQSREHALEVFRQVVPQLAPPEVEHRVSFRVKRQAILFRAMPAPYTAIIHEAALRMTFGGSSVAKHQLQHVLTMSEQDAVSVRVIPFAAGAYPGSGTPIYYVRGAVPQLDTVQLDQSHGIALLDAPAQLDKYRRIHNRLEEIALNPFASMQFIHSIAKTL